MRVEVDQHKCVAAGICVGIAPAVFDQRESDGKVLLLDEEPDEGQRDVVQEAAEYCPAFAISVQGRQL